MRYMFLIYAKERAEGETSADAKQDVARHHDVMEEAARRGVLRGADPLKPTSTATTIRMAENGRAMITDGSFAETKEQLAGYYIIECRDLDDAIEWGKKIPTGCQGDDGCVEIRPIHEMVTRH